MVTQSRPDLEVAGIKFVWIADLPLSAGKGGYVAKYEVSQGQYKAVAGTLPGGQPVANDDLPVNINSREEADRFCESLGEKARAGNSGFTGCALPNANQYLLICGLGPDSFDSNTTTVSAAAFGQLKLTGKSDTEHENTGVPNNDVRAVTVGGLNKFNLANVLGNALEWTADNRWFGLSHQTQGSAAQRNLVKPAQTPETRPRALVVGLRPILVRQP